MSETVRQDFQSLVENAAVSIVTTDLKGRFNYVNKALADLLGYSIKEIVGHPFKEFLHPDDKGRVTRLFLKSIFLRRELRNFEFRVVRKDGTVLYMMSKPHRFVVGGKKRGFQAIIIDITERKKAEEALKESEARYRNLFENAPAVILTHDLKGKITSINKAVENFGVERKNVIGKDILEFIPEKYRSELSKDFEKIMKGISAKNEMEVITPLGPKIVEYIGNPIRVGKRIVGSQTILRDITERRQMEKALQISEEKFRRIFESANDSLIYLDQSGRIIDVNEKTLRLFGGSREQLVGKHFVETDVFPPTEIPRLLSNFARILAGREGYTSLWIKNRLGEKRYLECSSSVMETNGKLSNILIVARDVTERKHMEKKLEEYSRKLEKLVEQRTKQLREAQEQLIKSERLAAIGEVAAMVGHDLRNPLTSINSAAYYLKKKLSKVMDNETKEMLKLIERDVQYSNKIITDLMEYSREIELELNETTPKIIIREALSLVEIPENVKTVDSTSNMPLIKLDIEKMKRVLSNLIKNAVDAMPRGGKLTISSRESNETVEFAIADTGVGMSKEVLEKIWTPFFTTKSKGMGLGLPISKRIIDAHGGKISVESVVNKGTTFTIMVPIKTEPKEEGGEKTWVRMPESLSLTTTKT